MADPPAPPRDPPVPLPGTPPPRPAAAGGQVPAARPEVPRPCPARRTAEPHRPQPELRGCHDTRETRHEPRARPALAPRCIRPSPALRFQTGSSNCRDWFGPGFACRTVGWGPHGWDTEQLQPPRGAERPRGSLGPVPLKDEPQDSFWTDARPSLALPAHQTEQMAKAGVQAAASRQEAALVGLVS